MARPAQGTAACSLAGSAFSLPAAGPCPPGGRSSVGSLHVISLGERCPQKRLGEPLGASELAAEGEGEGPSPRRCSLASQGSSVARVPALGGSAPGNACTKAVCRVGVLLGLGASLCPAAGDGLADALVRAGFLEIRQRWLQNSAQVIVKCLVNTGKCLNKLD